MFGGNNNAFGSSTTSTGFGSSGGFGQKPGGLFGASTSTGGGLFGGATTTNTGGGLFGQSTTNTGSGVFGNQATNAFGGSSTTSGGLFGNKTAAFGASNSGVLFGKSLAPATSTTSFGSTQSGGLFANPSVLPSAFGTTTTTTVGTTGVKFVAQEGQDSMVKNGLSQTIKTKHYCICAMKEYENKSIEELRYEDYAAGVKGPKGFTAASSSGFGTATMTVNPWDAKTTTQSSLFGGGTNTATNAFGASSLFGTKPQTSTTTNIFGQTAQPAASGGLFGNTTGTSTFGTPQNTAGSLFGTTATSKPSGLFGGTSTATGGSLFGQTSTASTGLFGKPTGFGTTTSTSAFGSNITGNSLFGNNKPLGFGNTGTSGTGAFGFNNTATTASTGFGFGQTASKPSLFGGFGTAANTFGTTGTANPLQVQQQNQPVQLAANLDLAAQKAKQDEINARILALTHSPFGDSPLFRSTQKPENAATNPEAQRAALASISSAPPINRAPLRKLQVTPKSNIRAIGVSGSASDVFEGLDGSSDVVLTPVRKNVKKLVLRSTPSSYRSGADDNSVRSLPIKQSRSGGASPRSTGFQRNKGSRSSNDSFVLVPPALSATQLHVNGNAPNQPLLDDTIAQLKTRTDSPQSLPERKPVPTRRLSDESEEVDVATIPHPCGIICTRSDYYTIPDLNELHQYLDEETGKCLIENFTVGRYKYGSIFFSGWTDVAGLDIDKVVHFRRKEVTVYPDDSNKPDLGEGLNKKAEVTLDQVWPTDKATHTPITSPERLMLMNWEQKLVNATARLEAKFVDFRPDTGSWVFEVKHFSKYGLMDDDSDEDNTTGAPKPFPLKTEAPVKGAPLTQTKTQLNKLNQTQTINKPKPGVVTLGGGDDQENVSPSKALAPRLQMDKTLSLMERGDEIEDEGKVDQVATKHWLAKGGIEPLHIQRMKASFMDDDDDEDMVASPLRSLNQSIGGSNTTSKYPSLLKMNSPLATTSPNSKDLKRPDSPTKGQLWSEPLSKQQFLSPLSKLKEKSQLPLLIPTISLPEPRYQQLPVICSKVSHPARPITGLASRLRKNLATIERDLELKDVILDAGLVNNARFRVGWHGPGILTHLTDVDSRRYAKPAMLEHQSDIFGSTVMLRDISSIQECDSHIQESQVKALEIQLANAQSEDFEDFEWPPLLTPSPGLTGLHEYPRECLNQLEAADCTQASQDTMKYLRYQVLVWDLMTALWGDLHEDVPNPPQPDSYVYLNSRREAFSRWLAYAAEKRYQVSEKREPIFDLLTAHRIADAATAALKQKDARLALLVAQAGSGAARQSVAQQILDWTASGADRFISHDKLKLYCLLSGVMTWITSDGTLISCYEGLDWLRCLALHLWYATPDATIYSAVQGYEQAVAIGDAAPPTSAGNTTDVLYHILQLYIDKRYPLASLLSSESSSADSLDYHTSWHLLQVLHSLGYEHLDKSKQVAIHIRYSDQLERLGLWHWALVPILNLKDMSARLSLVKSMLMRHIEVNSSEDEYCEKESFLLSQLRIAPQLINGAKAIKAASIGDEDRQVLHLIYSNQFQLAHHHLMESIAPRSILSKDTGDVYGLLESLNDHSHLINDWSTGGRVYFEFLSIQRSVEMLEAKDTRAAGQLLRQVKAYCKTLLALNEESTLQRVAQGQMAKQIAKLLRKLSEESADEGDVTSGLVQPISSLPLNSTDSLNELSKLMSSFMLEY